ncbi:zona pellucida sperm-binding protein 3d.2 [Embiotoca jacksoni]|uniref:zona pellucida sperm-binding protein 3d.2 n=1 Tax=Embiotoca jacksoni TaxID=100190 RepID=UPI003704C9B2
MFYLHLLLHLLLPMLSSEGATNQTAPVMRNVHRRETPPSYLRLPVFVDSKQPLVEKEHFSPAEGTGQEPLPEPVRGVLLPVRPATGPPTASAVSVRTSCRLGKMHVQVERSVLGTGETPSRLRLGTCRVSRSTGEHLHFEYDLRMCGTKRAVVDNQVAFSNTLRYDPPTVRGPIRRAAAFTLPVVCYFNRYQYSYKVGYTPRVRMHRVFKQMTNAAKFILTPRNARWERLSPSDQYLLGEPMYFETEALPAAPDQRLYVHSCFATPEKPPASTPQFPVVKNFGCMIESKEGRSGFVRHKNNSVRFSVDAFLFTGVTGQQLYMHCTMSMGSSAPTPTTKSCNYDTKAGRWVELSGSDSVCDCCDSDCSAAASTATQIISSRPWTIEPEAKPTPGLNRKAVSMATTVMTTTTERRKTPRPGATLAVKELEWPFGGGGVTWVEEGGEEKEVKGSAEQEEEEEEEEDEEVMTEPRRIFEEIFDFDE